MAKVVLVEDDAMLAEIYQKRLEMAGFDAIVANDGLTGLEVIKQNLPDLVLLDLLLPQMTGDEVLRQMRQSEWGKNIKVILLTNISESEAPEGLEQLGFERYIVKANISNNQLVEIINQVLSTPSQEIKEERAL